MTIHVASLIDKNPVKIRSMFDSIARRYDLLNSILSFGMDRKWRRIAASVCSKGDVVLDVACGTGKQAMEFCRRGAARVFAVDFSFQMLKGARRKTSRYGVHLVCADARYLPFKDDVFDVISISFGIRNIDNISLFISECSRISKSGADLAVLEFENLKNTDILYSLYMHSLMPTVGNVVSQTNAYTYLTKSLQDWLSFSALSALIRAGGFSQITSKVMVLGSVRFISAKRGDTALLSS